MLADNVRFNLGTLQTSTREQFIGAHMHLAQMGTTPQIQPQV